MDPATVAASASAASDGANFFFGLGDRLGWFGGQDGGAAADDARWMNDFSWKQSLRNEAFQNELARHGIKMRVDDAVASGLHPLVGAGVNPASGGFGGTAFTGVPSPERRQMSGLDFGQNISRAISATRSPEEKALMAVELRRQMAEADLAGTNAQIARRQLMEMSKTPPLPAKYRSFMNSDGTTESVYSPDYSQAIMSDPIGMWATSLKKAFGGPDTGPFWSTVGSSARRLMHPWRE